MNSEEFIQGILRIRKQICEAVNRTLDRPPGRSPRQKDVMLSKFYHSLNEEQKDMLKKVIEESTDTSIFVLLCILDHVHFIEETPDKTKFELYAVKDGEKVLLNDEELFSLHDEYNSHVLDGD